MIATWGSREFYISPNELKGFDEFSESYKLNVSNEENEGGKDSTVIKGEALNDLSIKIVLKQTFGNDVQAEHDAWVRELKSRKPKLFVVGNKLLSNNPYLLTEVSPSNKRFNNEGTLLSVEISLKFQEVAELLTIAQSEAREKAKKAKANKKAV